MKNKFIICMTLLFGGIAGAHGASPTETDS